MFEFLKKGILGAKPRRIALFIDGPNLLRKELDSDLSIIKREVEKFGELKITKVFLNQFAPHKLIEAVANQGFEPVIGIGDVENDQASDVDVYVAVAAMEAVFNVNIDILAIATRDADFLPLFQRAKEMGKEVILIGQSPGFSKALQHAADHIIDLQKTGKA